ncbi:hypothetical protein JCM11641_006853 [Rhodosporidiobolus odoratus]
MPPKQWGPPPQQPKPELTPQHLAELWKKQGGFDLLRRELLNEFLASPERDALLTRLDTLLPTLLSSTPAVARQARRDRSSYLTSELERRDALKEASDKLEVRLSGKKGAGKRVERELRDIMRKEKGLPPAEVGENDAMETIESPIPRLVAEPVPPIASSSASNIPVMLPPLRFPSAATSIPAASPSPVFGLPPRPSSHKPAPPVLAPASSANPVEESISAVKVAGSVPPAAREPGQEKTEETSKQDVDMADGPSALPPMTAGVAELPVDVNTSQTA